MTGNLEQANREREQDLREERAARVRQAESARKANEEYRLSSQGLQVLPGGRDQPAKDGGGEPAELSTAAIVAATV